MRSGKLENVATKLEIVVWRVLNLPLRMVHEDKNGQIKIDGPSGVRYSIYAFEHRGRQYMSVIGPGDGPEVPLTEAGMTKIAAWMMAAELELARPM